MNVQEITIVARIRELSRGARGRETFVLSLSDEAIYAVYLQLKNGASNRSVARLLQAKYSLQSSENSLQQGISKLRKRISPLLETPSIDRIEETIADSERLPPEERLTITRQIEKDYYLSIEIAAAEARKKGVLIHDLPKHLSAVTDLSKTADQLEEDLKEKKRAADKASFERELKEKSDFALKHFIGNDGNKLLRAADKLLTQIKEASVKMEWDEETQKFYPPELLPKYSENSPTTVETKERVGQDVIGTTTTV